MHREIASFTCTPLYPTQSLFHFMIIATSTNSWTRNFNEYGTRKQILF